MAEERSENEAQNWVLAFNVQENEPEFARLLRLMELKHGDIYTSRLHRSVSLGGAVADGRVQLLGRVAPLASHDILRLLSIIILHGRMARAGVVTIRKPAFFVRTPAGPRAAFPVEHICGICGLERKTLNAMLAPLAQDGVIRIVLDAEGHEAVVANDGFTDDTYVRRFLRY